MQLLRPSRIVTVLCTSVICMAVLNGTLAWSAGQAPSPQAAASPSQAVLVPQAQVVYETVNTVECVQVPVTQMQTQYRTEYRNEAVPVTRMISEVVNEPRTVTVCVPKQQTINKQVTRYVCEPVTETKRFHRPIPVTKTVQRTVYQAYCTTEAGE